MFLSRNVEYVDSLPMNFSWLREKLTHLVHHKGNIQTSEGQILQATNNTAIPKRIFCSEKSTCISSKPLGGDHRSGSGVTNGKFLGGSTWAE
jgi:hypothetical protein